ncbi:hypothetical protein DIPPA_15712 [Diplonema papillatum]|nr:hypothetical protein DIPPA_15712 [Diplonema papillatum]
MAHTALNAARRGDCVMEMRLNSALRLRPLDGYRTGAQVVAQKGVTLTAAGKGGTSATCERRPPKRRRHLHPQPPQLQQQQRQQTPGCSAPVSPLSQSSSGDRLFESRREATDAGPMPPAPLLAGAPRKKRGPGPKPKPPLHPPKLDHHPPPPPAPPSASCKPAGGQRAKPVRSRYRASIFARREPAAAAPGGARVPALAKLRRCVAAVRAVARLQLGNFAGLSGKERAAVEALYEAAAGGDASILTTVSGLRAFLAHSDCPFPEGELRLNLRRVGFVEGREAVSLGAFARILEYRKHRLKLLWSRGAAEEVFFALATGQTKAISRADVEDWVRRAAGLGVEVSVDDLLARQEPGMGYLHFKHVFSVPAPAAAARAAAPDHSPQCAGSPPARRGGNPPRAGPPLLAFGPLPPAAPRAPFDPDGSSGGLGSSGEQPPDATLWGCTTALLGKPAAGADGEAVGHAKHAGDLGLLRRRLRYLAKASEGGVPGGRDGASKFGILRSAGLQARLSENAGASERIEFSRLSCPPPRETSRRAPQQQQQQQDTRPAQPRRTAPEPCALRNFCSPAAGAPRAAALPPVRKRGGRRPPAPPPLSLPAAAPRRNPLPPPPPPAPGRPPFLLSAAPAAGHSRQPPSAAGLSSMDRSAPRPVLALNAPASLKTYVHPCFASNRHAAEAAVVT